MDKKISLMPHHILIVEDDLTFSTMLRTWLGKKGFLVDTASTVGKAVKSFLETDSPYDLVLSDMRLPDHDGLFLLEWLKKQGMSVPFIVMTHYAEVQNAVEAMKAGAVDYISKPVQPDILLQKINEAIASAQSQAAKPVPAATVQERQTAPAAGGSRKDKSDTASATGNFKYLEGESEAAKRLYGYVSLVAPTPMSVLILGASGTGKEYVARRIHQLSRRADGPFIAMDCGALTKDLSASELFGHVKGAFTGATSDKDGAFVEASGGTLFLDEVGNLGYDVQVQLLRVLQERRVRPVGTAKETPVDIRLVCATNEDLAAAVARGDFREDLYHRINEFTLYMPRLSERGADVLLFADFFLKQANRELERSVEGFDPRAAEMLAQYSWPGNLRELKNVVKRATLLCQGRMIRPEDLAGVFNQPSPQSQSPMPLHDSGTERERIEAALRSTGGNKSRAAILLGVDRKTLYNKMKSLGMM